MKVLLDNGGQTCNKFWCYISSLQDGFLNGSSFILPFYDVEIDSYPSLRSCKFFKYPFYSKRINSWLGIKKYMNLLELPVNNRYYNLIPKLKTKKCIIDGWETRKVRLLPQYKESILSLFKPSSEIVNRVNEAIGSIREKDRKIIGVHVRRGDYKYWKNGAYYYSFEQYVDICKKVQAQFNGDVAFFIASNEDIPKALFSCIDYYRIEKGTMPEDLYGLSICDYIIGPPSSFSRWASFCGGVPISFIQRVNQEVFNFRTIESYSFYTNGDRVEFDF